MSERKRKRTESATATPAPAPAPAQSALTSDEIDSLGDDFVFYDQQRDEYCYYRDIRDFASFMQHANAQIVETTKDAKCKGKDRAHYRKVANGELQEKHVVNYEALNGAMDARLITKADADKWKVPLFIKRVQELHTLLYPKKPVDEIRVSGFQAAFIASLLR